MPTNQNEQNKIMLRRAQAGDNQALSWLCEHNIGFVKQKAKKHYKAYGSDLAMDDLVQEGMIGLMEAIDRADPDRTTTFLTYAGFYVERCVINANIQQGFLIRYPYNIFCEIANLIKADQLFCYLEGQKKTEALAKYLDSSEQRIEAVYEWAAYMPYMQNEVDEVIGHRSVPSTDFPVEQMEQESLRSTLFKLLEGLTDREKTVISMRFGLRNGKEYSLDEVSKHFGVTRERIRQIEAKALRKLRHPQRTQMLLDFWN